MELIQDLNSFNGEELALTIGYFDGVHAGHRYLIDQLCEIAHQEGLRSAILTFTTHPRDVLNEEYIPKLLNTTEEKRELIKGLDIDYGIEIPFTTELSNLLAFDFMNNILKKKLKVKHLLIGYDHRFGRNREEGFDDYCQYGEELGIKVTRAEVYMENDFSISSSFIRNLLKVSEIRLANHYLGYTYSLSGTITEGEHIATRLGFPTANLQLDDSRKCVPGIGVYAVEVVIDQKPYSGMAYIGTHPTRRKGHPCTIEAHLFDYNGNLYGKEMTLKFIDFIRKQVEFDSEETLKVALRTDSEKAKQLCRDYRAE